MALSVRIMQYFYTKVEDQPANAYDLLAKLASEEINLLAFSAVPFGAKQFEFTVFPNRSDSFVRLAKKLGWTLRGPQYACLIQGDDHLGALAEIQKALVEAGVSIYASSGVTDGNGHFGYVIYFRDGDQVAASKALEALQCLR